ncbi:MAG: NAD(P)-dependent oxidoreductase [Desulfuromonas sp.]|nr:MAG: NAD(P)-dependent oxidoreductase [Desulfuromonas sp.]
MQKTVVITGATSGFGKACVERFAGDGCRMILVGRREQRLAELQEQYPDNDVHLLPLDVRNREEVFTAFANLPEPFQTVDVLVNNAGLALGLEPSWETDIKDWEVMVDTNIKGVLYCTRALLPGMVDRKNGSIVNIGSVAGNWPYPGGNVYGATKSFVQQFSRNLRCDLLGKNVRVTNIEPGMAETEFSINRFKGDKEKAANVYKGIQPLTGKDIAEAVHWVVHLPPHVNVNTLELMATNQAWSPFNIHRSEEK